MSYAVFCLKKKKLSRFSEALSPRAQQQRLVCCNSRPRRPGRPGGWCFFFNDTATTEIYTLSLHDALPIPRIRASDVVWVEPRLVCEAEFAEWTRDGRLR